MLGASISYFQRDNLDNKKGGEGQSVNFFSFSFYCNDQKNKDVELFIWFHQARTDPLGNRAKLCWALSTKAPYALKFTTEFVINS